MSKILGRGGPGGGGGGGGGDRKEGNDAWNLQTSNRAEQQTAKQNTRGNGSLPARSGLKQYTCQ